MKASRPVFLFVCFLGWFSFGESMARQDGSGRPGYLNLRHEEDFGFLDSLDAGPSDLFDPVKNIRLGAHLRLQLGGEVRLRHESERNKFLQNGPGTYDTFLLYRTALHLDARVGRHARLFVEGIHADVSGRDERLFFIHRNRHDVHQLFVDARLPVGDRSLTLRVGRQELVYGRERLFSASGWGRVRKRFDAVTAIWRHAEWWLDVWAARPVTIDMTGFDRGDEARTIFGAYGSTTGNPRLRPLCVRRAGSAGAPQSERPVGRALLHHRRRTRPGRRPGTRL